MLRHALPTPLERAARSAQSPLGAGAVPVWAAALVSRDDPRECIRARLGLGFVVAFALLLIAPAAQTAFRFAHVAPVDEHRLPAQFPAASLLLRDASGFSDALNRWFDDRIGLRDLLIRLKTQIDYSLFGVAGKVYLGSDGWLFDRERTNDRLDLERLGERDYLTVERSFHDLARLLAGKGVRLVLVAYPDKSMLYPEHLPADVPVLPRERLDRLRRSLAADPALDFVDVESLLRPLKGGDRLFYQTDLHPNLAGTVPVMKEIIRRIASDEGRGDIAWNEPIAWTHAVRTSGGEARFLPLLTPVVENIRTGGLPGPPRGPGVDGPDGRWIADDRVVEYADVGKSPIFRWAFQSTPEACATRLPGAMLFGNSFSDPYEAFDVPRYFCFMRRAKTPVERLWPFIADMPSGIKYFIYQFTMTYLPCEAPLHPGALTVPPVCTM
jgi:SGNH hydrolase-like domain, acetyltransferase AlgX